MSARRRRFPFFSYALVVAGALIMVVPFLDMVFTSFKGPGEAGRLPYHCSRTGSTSPTTRRPSTNWRWRSSSATASS